MSTVDMKPAEKPKPQLVQLDELRCPICGKVLAKVRLVPGSVVQVRCRHCRLNVLKECA